MEDSFRQTAFEIACEAYAKVGALSLVVNGESMLPTLRPGDRILIEPLAEKDARRGEVIAVRRDNICITHRLIGRDRRGWYTQGDHARGVDPPFEWRAVLGKVKYVQRGDQGFELAYTRWGAWKSSWNWFVYRAKRLYWAVITLWQH